MQGYHFKITLEMAVLNRTIHSLLLFTIYEIMKSVYTEINSGNVQLTMLLRGPSQEQCGMAPILKMGIWLTKWMWPSRLK
jgi:hypothetical protein